MGWVTLLVVFVLGVLAGAVGVFAFLSNVKPPLPWMVLLAFACAGQGYADDATKTPPPPCGIEEGAEKSCGALVSIVAGASAAVSAGEGGIKPLVLIAFDGPIAKTRYSPRLIAGVDLGAGKGEAVNLADPATFRTLTFRVLVAQPIKGLFVAPYFGGGFATRVESDPDPIERTARWWGAGLRMAGSRGWLELGAGLDDRLGDDYQPTAHARGALLLGDRGGVNAWLIGEAILGLRLGYSGTEGRVDVVTIGVGVGR